MTDETGNQENLNPNRPARDRWGSSREHVIAGLHALAAFIEENPGLPIPDGAYMNYSVIEETDEQERAEVDRIAAMLGVNAGPNFSGNHYVATAFFGPVLYRAVAISEEEMERHNASNQIDVIRSEDWPI